MVVPLDTPQYKTLFSEIKKKMLDNEKKLIYIERAVIISGCLLSAGGEKSPFHPTKEGRIMRDFLTKWADFSVLGLPLGAASLFLATMGIGGGVMGIGRRVKVPPVLAGGILSYLATRGFAVRGLGPGASDLAGTALLLEGADLQFGAVDWVVSLMERVPFGLPMGEALLAEEMGGYDELGGSEMAGLGQGEEMYLTDVERKVQSTMRAQMM